MDENEVKYPYLGKRTVNGNDYVVLFVEKNYGVVVMSDVQGVEALEFGKLGDFDEKMFTYLEKGVCVRLEN